MLLYTCAKVRREEGEREEGRGTMPICLLLHHQTREREGEEEEERRSQPEATKLDGRERKKKRLLPSFLFFPFSFASARGGKVLLSPSSCD